MKLCIVVNMYCVHFFETGDSLLRFRQSCGYFTLSDVRCPIGELARTVGLSAGTTVGRCVFTGVRLGIVFTLVDIGAIVVEFFDKVSQSSYERPFDQAILSSIAEAEVNLEKSEQLLDILASIH